MGAEPLGFVRGQMRMIENSARTRRGALRGWVGMRWCRHGLLKGNFGPSQWAPNEPLQGGDGLSESFSLLDFYPRIFDRDWWRACRFDFESAWKMLMNWVEIGRRRLRCLRQTRSKFAFVEQSRPEKWPGPRRMTTSSGLTRKRRNYSSQTDC